MIEANILRENGQIYQARIVYELDDRQEEYVNNVSSLEDVELEALKLANEIGDYNAIYYDDDEDYEHLDLEAAYERFVDSIKDKYEDKMKAFLEDTASFFEEDLEIVDTSDDVYSWSIFPSYASIAFSIEESRVHSGTLEGVNFAVQVVGNQGEILGGKKPFNYSRKCWVPVWDDEAIRIRFNMFYPPIDCYDIATLVKGLPCG